jgi:hypothetical protein
MTAGGPLFVLGCGRSGTTLLQRIFNSYDDVVLYGEHGGLLAPIAEAWLGMLESPRVDEELWKQNASARDRAEVRAVLRDPRRWSPWINWFDRAALADALRAMIETLFRDPSARWWGFKEIRYGDEDRTIDLLRGLYPEARFVFIARRPLDVVASQTIAFAPPVSVWGVARRWTRQNRRFLDERRARPELSRLVRLEDLDADALGALLAWLDLPFGDRQREILTMPEGRGSRRDRDARPSEQVLAPDEIEAVAKITREVAAELGYPT